MKQYVVDAFTDTVFHGNPAAVCLPETALDDALMLSIARENNLSETAFAVPTETGYHLRWFTPGGEIDLCGHATLATGFVLMHKVVPEASSISFETLSGTLTVTRRQDQFEMDFPAYELTPTPVTEAMEKALGVRPLEAVLGRDLLCVLADEKTVRTLTPDLEQVATLEGLLVHVTAAGTAYDCVSRSFGLKLGVPEDPVCGSGHCHIFPYWSARTGRDALTGYQASARGGVLWGNCTRGRVRLSGHAVLFSETTLFI